ncbi:hypothetical protein Gotur_012900 [Gossypium turneri]
MFVSVWIDQHINFGERTTNRVESQHAKLKKYVCAKNSSLDKFVGCIDQIVKSQLTSIYESFEKTTVPLPTSPHPRSVAPHNARTYNKSNHEQQMVERFLPVVARRRCPCCALFGSKLKRGNFGVRSKGEDEAASVAAVAANEMGRSHSTTSKSVGLDLVKLNREPARHSSYVIKIPDLNQEPSEQVSDFIDLNQMLESYDTHPLMKEIPDMFHPYIIDVQDVRGDGNCGFRAISVCLGYSEDQCLYVCNQLLDALLSSYDVYARVFTDGINELRNSLCFSQSPSPAEHWMVMPMAGVLIANRFGVILNYLTKRGDITFFPLWRGPEHFQYHHAITIAHVYDNHNVMVQLEGDYQMPTISAYWIRHRAPSTARWQIMYMLRLEFYRQLKPYNLKTPVITIEDYC